MTGSGIGSGKGMSMAGTGAGSGGATGSGANSSSTAGGSASDGVIGTCHATIATPAAAWTPSASSRLPPQRAKPLAGRSLPSSERAADQSAAP